MTHGMLLSWGASLLRLAGLTWILLLGWGTGRLMLRRFTTWERRPSEDAAVSIGLGLGTISLLTLGLGATAGYRPLAIAGFLAALSMAALLGFRGGRPLKFLNARSPEAGRNLPLLLLLAGAVPAGIAALSPPLFYDALVYHLGVPNLYLLRGHLEPLPRIVYSNFPLGTEMLYVLGLFIGGPELAGAINFAFALLAAFAIAELVRPRWGSRPAAVAAALFVLSPQVLLLSRFATAELAMTFFVLLSYLCLIRWREDERPSTLILAGVFGGFAFSTKYLGGIFAVLIPAGALLAGRRLRALPTLLLPAGVTASPWLVKNLLFTGNPVYPAFFQLFGGDGWSLAQAKALDSDAHAAWTMSSSWKDWLLLPWDIVVQSKDFGVPDEGGWVWIIVFAAAAFMATRRAGGVERLLALLFAACLLAWAVTFRIARFLLPGQALGAILIALALEHLGSRRRRHYPGAAVALFAVGTLVTLFNDPIERRSLLRALRPAVGLQTRDEYLRSSIRIWPAVDLVNRHLPRDARVLLLGDAKGAYLRRDYVATTVLDRPLLPDLIGGEREFAGIAAALRRAGITHVLVNMRELERTEGSYALSRTPPELLSLFGGFLEHGCRLLFKGNGVSLFELPGPSPAGEHRQLPDDRVQESADGERCTEAICG